MALSKPNLKTLKNSTLEPSIDKSILNVNIDGVLQNKAGAVYVEDPNGYLQKIYITDNFGNYQQLIRTTTKQDIYLGQEFKKNEGYTEILGSDLTSPLNFLSTWLEASVDSKTYNTFTVGGSGRGMYFMLPENKTLKINVSGVTGSVELRYRTTTGGAGTVLGDFDTDLYLTTTNATTNIYLRATGAGTVSFTDVSVKEDTLYVE